jgi:hypothetical protein
VITAQYNASIRVRYLAVGRVGLEQVDGHRGDEHHRADEHRQGVELEALLHQHLAEGVQVARVAEQLEQTEQQEQAQEAQRPIAGQDGQQVDDGHGGRRVGQLAFEHGPHGGARAEGQAHQLGLLPMLDEDLVAVVEEPHAQQVFSHEHR